MRSVEIDGWEARFSGGYTGRANSTTTVGEGKLALDDRIARIEAAYAEAGQPPWFRIPDFSDDEVTRALDARGYSEAFRGALVLAAADPERGNEIGIRITRDPEADWLDAHAAADNVPPQQRAVHDALFAKVGTPRWFAGALEGQRIVSVAMVALIGELAVIQGVGTRAESRRRGHARRVMRALLAESWRHGARGAMLQVAVDNDVAQAMYGGLGFERTYQYAYRRTP
ncbi:MAG: acetyltransferase, family [Rhodospirillales bacterium]|nr:acetyltransferase, family [Rhodospirillales bacterium]